MTFVCQTDRQAHRQKRKKHEGKLINKWHLYDRQTDRQTASQTQKEKTMENSLINEPYLCRFHETPS